MTKRIATAIPDPDKEEIEEAIVNPVDAKEIMR